jgi:hypothetical protein
MMPIDPALNLMAVPEKLYPGQNDSGEAIKNEMSS